MKNKTAWRAKNNSGQILAEILLAVGVFSVIGIVVAELANTSTRFGASALHRTVQLRLAEEAAEILRAIGQGNDGASQGWNRIYLPPDGTGDPVTSKGAENVYHPELFGGYWALAAGEEILTLSEQSYGRRMVITNVSRDTTGNIETVYQSANDDPSTQKITITVTSSSSPAVSLAFYLTRYLNEGSRQSDWGGGINGGPFAATSTITTITATQNTDVGGSACGAGTDCIRLQEQ